MQGDDQGGGNFHLNDGTFLAFEKALAASPWSTPDLFSLRVNIFLHLGYDTPPPELKRFRLGLLSYFPWLLRAWWLGHRTRYTGDVPKTDFVVLVYGTVSKEVDTLAPVAAALTERHHSVTLVWATDQDPDHFKFSATKVLQISPRILTASSFGTLCRDLLYCGSVLFRLRWGMARFPGFRAALRKRWLKLFDYLVHVRFWEHYLEDVLSTGDPQAVAFVADTSVCGEALARLCRQRHIPSHHFLHGFPGLIHTRSLATDIFCFSKVEPDYFREHGWSAAGVHAIGHPRQDAITDAIRKIRTIRPEAGGLRVLFASQLAVVGAFDQKHYCETASLVLEAAQRLGLTQIEYRVRLHPADDASAYTTIAKNFPADLGREAVSSAHLTEDLAWANLVLTASSTVAIEAAYAGCFVVWVLCGTFRIEVQKRLIAAGYGLAVSNADELIEILQRFRDPLGRATMLSDFLTVAKTLNIVTKESPKAAAILMENSSPFSQGSTKSALSADDL